MTRFSLTLTAIALMTSAHAASAQSSQAAATDPVDTATIRLGPVGLNPALMIRDVGRDNNVFNDPDNPRSDFTATISPRVELVTSPGPMRLSYITTTDYVYYQTYTSERGTNLGNQIRTDFEFGPFQPSFDAHFDNTRERPNREIDTRARHHDRNYGGNLRVQLPADIFVSAGARQTQTTFDPGVEFRGQDLATTLDRTDDLLEAGAGVALTPLTTFQVDVGRERARFDFTPERDSQTLRIMPKVTFSPLAMLNGSASFGYRRFTTHSPDVPNFRGFVSSVTLASTVLEHHHIETTFARDLQYSYEEAVPEYIETGLTVGWNWAGGGPLDARLYGSRSRLHYRSPTLADGKTDDVAHTFGFTVAWRLAAYLRAGVNGDWRGRASDRSADRAYDNRRIYATFTWGKVS